ncbi:MAG: TylF/MycF/NovP-related O-methyltransferase [Acidobacteriota bacterium]
MINSLLSPLGLSLSRTNSTVPLVDAQRHFVLVAEVESVLRELLFPDLPVCERRTELLARLFGTNVTEGMYLLAYLHKSLRFEGDVCEFGVAQGATSALIANEIRSTEKSLWLFDSFRGLPKPSEKDELIDDIFDLKTIENYEGTMACPIEMVESNLNAIQFPPERAKIVAGFIDETLGRLHLPEKVCFAYVDFDFYEPILTALRFLHERLSPRGYIMVDDYGFFSSGAQTAVDEFVGECGDIYQLSLPHKSAGRFCMLHKTR